ncbi:MAG TPA: helix-turn-helix domain-containing protein [Acidobacteriaceae bacterium]
MAPETVTPTLPDEILLQEVLRSRTFERTSSLSRLLAYIWEQQGRGISEYAIATEALGRPADFDSKTDATVRVQIGRLRRMLDKFYAAEGSHCTRRLAIPSGSHQLAIVEVEEGQAEESALPAGPALRDPMPSVPQAESPVAVARPLISNPIGYALLAGVLLCAVLLTIGLFQRGPAVKEARREPPPFWKAFTDNGKNTRIVLPAPLFFAWQAPGGHALMLRDIRVNDPAKWQGSPALTEIVGKQRPAPHIWQNYTVASDTFASLRLARFLDGFGIRTSFSSSASVPDEIVDHENIITFGTKSSLASYQTDLDRLSFRMAQGEVKVTDLLSPANNRKEFLRMHESGERDVVPGIVAVIPRAGSDCWLMLVQGTDTMALIDYLTSDEGMREILEATREMKTPYFEAVVLSEVNRGTPLQSRLGAIRPFVQRSPETMAKLLQVQETKR